MTFLSSLLPKKAKSKKRSSRHTESDPEKYERCVKKVKKAGTADSPHAVCTAQLGAPDKKKESPKVVKGPDADGGISTKFWFWGAEFPVQQKVNGPKPPTQTPQQQPTTQAQTQETPEERARKILIEYPNISAATFLNTLKSKGLKLEFEVNKEADSASSHVAVTRESNKFIESIRFTMLESDPKTKGIGPTKFKTILLREGLGNLKDGFFYTRKCLENAVPLFEGQQMFADHPDMLEEKTRPERSVRDLIGHFENVRIEEDEDGSALLVGDSVLLNDKENEWARSRVLHATDFNKKYPDKDFVALSINANGGAEELPVEQFIESYDLSETAKIKLKNAIEKGLQNIRVVEGFEGSFSCDLVTKAGAGGKVLSMLEKDKDMEEGGPGSGRKPGGGASDQTSRRQANLSKSQKDQASFQKKSGAIKKGIQDSGARKAWSEHVKSLTQARKQQRMQQNESQIKGDSMSDDKSKQEAGEHADEQKDQELIQSMLKKHGLVKDGEEPQEADMSMVKEMYQAYKELGYKEQEAAEAAGHSMKLAKHMGAKKEAEGGDEDKEQEAAKVDDKGYHCEADKDKKVESLRQEVLALKANLVKFQEADKKKELSEYLDEVLQKSKLPNTVTKSFREAVGEPKNKEQIDRDFKIFQEAYKAKDTEGVNIFIPEKTNSGGTTGSGGFSDCLN